MITFKPIISRLSYRVLCCQHWRWILIGHRFHLPRLCRTYVSSAPTRWGICSVGLISHDFTAALQMRPSEHQAVAVASRDLQRAQTLATKFSIPKTYNSYEELADDPEIDVVYIANLHPFHLETCKLFLEKGKNILCEKPLAMNMGQVSEILQLAKEKGVFFMEGFWSLFFPSYDQLRTELSTGTIGTPKFLNVNFGVDTFPAEHRHKFSEKASGGGAVLRAGCYLIMFANLIFPERPEKVYAAGFLNSSGLDTAASITLLYSGNRMAQLNVTFECVLDQKAIVCGTKGSIQMPRQFWMADTLITPEKTFTFDRPKSLTTGHNFADTQCLIYEADAVRQCLLKGEKECNLMSHKDSMQIMWIMDEVRRKLGVTYDADFP